MLRNVATALKHDPCDEYARIRIAVTTDGVPVDKVKCQDNIIFSFISIKRNAYNEESSWGTIKTIELFISRVVTKHT